MKERVAEPEGKPQPPLDGARNIVLRTSNCRRHQHIPLPYALTDAFNLRERPALKPVLQAPFLLELSIACCHEMDGAALDLVQSLTECPLLRLLL